jgi:MtN3 and saliva related transmembrane protein
MTSFTDLLGLVAGALTTTAFVPQVLKIYRTKSGKDISGRMIALFSAGVLLWLAYGILIASTPVIIANAVTLVLAVAIIVLKVRYSRPRDRRPPGPRGP